MNPVRIQVFFNWSRNPQGLVMHGSKLWIMRSFLYSYPLKYQSFVYGSIQTSDICLIHRSSAVLLPRGVWVQLILHFTLDVYRSLPVYPRLGLTIIWGFLWLYIYILRCHYFLGSSNLRHIRFVIFVTCLEQQLQEHTQYNRTSGETCLKMDLSSPCRAFLGKALRKRYWLDTLNSKRVVTCAAADQNVYWLCVFVQYPFKAVSLCQYLIG